MYRRKVNFPTPFRLRAPSAHQPSSIYEFERHVVPECLSMSAVKQQYYLFILHKSIIEYGSTRSFLCVHPTNSLALLLPPPLLFFPFFLSKPLPIILERKRKVSRKENV